MGDRGNILISTGTANEPCSGFVALYTHNRGSEIARYVAYGLGAVAARWDDAPYLATAVLRPMLEENGHGPGIGIDPTGWEDNEHAIIVLDTFTLLAHVMAAPHHGYRLTPQTLGASLDCTRSAAVPFADIVEHSSAFARLFETVDGALL